MFEFGMERVKIDFHLHTQKDKEFKYAGDDFVKDYVDALEQNNIHIGIITNHNKFDYEEYKAIKKAAKKREIFILPGVELSVKQGANAVHALVIFNPNEWLANGQNHISKTIDSLFLGIDNAENENTSANEDLMGCIQILNKLEKDYFIVMAHVEQKSGFLCECKGGLIKSLAERLEFRERVLGFQKVRSRDLIGKARNWMGYEISSVEGSDPKTIDQIGKGNDFTFLKIGDYSFGAVKYALKDYKNRVFSESSKCTHGYIESVRCLGGKLDGQELKLSNKLNTFIGIRGSGKSSVLEIMRYALDLEPATDIDYKRSLVKSVLDSGGQIILSVVDKFGKRYEIRRILNESVSVIDTVGNTLSIPVNTVLDNPLYFGQKDLALTRAGYELELLNRIAGKNNDDVKNEISKIAEELAYLITKLKNISDIPAKIAEITDKNAEIQHKLKIYKEKGVDEKLKKQTACNEDLSKLEIISENVKQILLALENAYDDNDIQGISLNEYTSEFNKDIFETATLQSQEAIQILHNIRKNVSIFKNKYELLNDSKKRLEEKIESLKEEFAQIKREINDSSLDLDSFVLYQKQLTDNNAEIEKLKEKLGEKSQTESAIKRLIDKRNEILQNNYQEYVLEINNINKSQEQLKISIEFKGNKEQLKNDIQTSFRGTGISESKYKELADEFSDFTAILEDFYLNSGKKLKLLLSDAAYNKVISRLEDYYKDYLKKECPNAIKITYHGKLLSRHSIGQRASALILFILTQHDSDLIIIDQPEDDLDNQVIYKELIQTIREKKEDMQFVFATHNANIPVLGDAERIVTTVYDGDTGKILMDQGNIDVESSHEAIIDIMEGGEEAFKKRNDIYTAW